LRYREYFEYITILRRGIFVVQSLHNYGLLSAINQHERPSAVKAAHQGTPVPFDTSQQCFNQAWIKE